MPCATTTHLNILVVDDSEAYLQAVSRLLATYPCTGAVRQALSAAEALAEMVAFAPDLMLVDVAMPEVNGLELTRAIKARPSPPRIIIVTMYDTATYREAAATAGADGFLGKSQLGERLQQAIAQLFPEECGEASP